MVEPRAPIISLLIEGYTGLVNEESNCSVKAMTPEKWQKIKNIFATAKEMPVAERRNYLGDACDEDQEISSEVIRLLDSYEEDNSFLEHSAVAEVASMFEKDNISHTASNEPDSPRFEPGTLLNKRYEIVRLLGKGGMGEVFLAYDKNIDRKVALKVLPAELTENKSRLQRFEQEARAVSALNHPHILTIFEFGKSVEGDHYIASEYVEGKTLSALIATSELSLSKILEIVMQVASALGAAHEAGITHRDIKLDNIMIRDDGYVKVLDFGLAKLTEAERSLADPEAATKAQFQTAPGSVMGTAAYMSPEQARGLEVDARTDLWSLGVVMYELITGQLPFRGDTSTDTIVAVIKQEPAPISSYVSYLPPEMEWIISKTLSKELDGRYQTAKELHADIAKIKKQVEFLDDKERTAQPVKVDFDNESLTAVQDGTPTDVKEVVSTKEFSDGLGPSGPSGRESSFEYAVKGFGRHKAAAAAIAFCVVAVMSAAVYYTIFIAGASKEIDSIAVLPLENGNGGTELNYLAEGISESLIDRLSQLPQLRVIARSSSWKFAGTSVDVQDVGRQLGVGAVLMGKVTKINGVVTIRVELINARNSSVIWSNVYERNSGDVLTVQNEVARTVGDTLKLKLTHSQEKRLSNPGTDNPDAYNNYLNGLVELRSKIGVDGPALDYFLKAVELDPNFAQAHAEISLIYSTKALKDQDPNIMMPKAKASALKALELDKDLDFAHVALATVQEFEFDWSEAGKSYERAITLNPNLASARNRYAFYLSVLGRNEEAFNQNEKVMLLDPINKRLNLQFKSMNLMQARRFDEGLATIKEAAKIESSGNALDFFFGYGYGGKGMWKESADAFKTSANVYGGENRYSQSVVYMAAANARIPEKRNEAVEIVKRLETTDEYVSPSILAVLYAALGEKEKAIDELEKAFEQKDVLLRYIKVGYEYDGLREDPRFKTLLKQTGLDG